MIRNVGFDVFWGTLLRPTAGAVVSSVVPKIHHPAKHSLAMFEHTGGVLRDFIVVIHRDICREHSLVGRRNCFMTEKLQIRFQPPEARKYRQPGIL